MIGCGAVVRHKAQNMNLLPWSRLSHAQLMIHGSSNVQVHILGDLYALPMIFFGRFNLRVSQGQDEYLSGFNAVLAQIRLFGLSKCT